MHSVYWSFLMLMILCASDEMELLFTELHYKDF